MTEKQYLVSQPPRMGKSIYSEKMEDKCKHCSQGCCMIFDCICEGVNMCGVDE